MPLVFADTLSDPSAAEHVTIISYLIWDSANLRAKPQGQGDALIPLSIGLHAHCLLRYTKLRWSYCNPPPHGVLQNGARTHIINNYLSKRGLHWKRSVDHKKKFLALSPRANYTD
jgi:hypothetical protein